MPFLTLAAAPVRERVGACAGPWPAGRLLRTRPRAGGAGRRRRRSLRPGGGRADRPHAHAPRRSPALTADPSTYVPATFAHADRRRDVRGPPRRAQAQGPRHLPADRQEGRLQAQVRQERPLPRAQEADAEQHGPGRVDAPRDARLRGPARGGRAGPAHRLRVRDASTARATGSTSTSSRTTTSRWPTCSPPRSTSTRPTPTASTYGPARPAPTRSTRATRTTAPTSRRWSPPPTRPAATGRRAWPPPPTSAR